MATIQASDIAAIFNQLRDQRDEARAELVTARKVMDKVADERDAARAETTRVLFDLVACMDERAALRARIALLESENSKDNDTCERCGSTYRVTFEPDPYQHDINGDDTPVWECARCRSESAADI